MIFTLGIAYLTGCAEQSYRPRMQDLKIGDNISIYSESNLALAQDKADKLCGSHAYFLIDFKNGLSLRDAQYQSITFNCDVEQAAHSGNQEAREIQNKKSLDAHKEYVRTVEKIKDARRKAADPNKYESYTETDAYGNVRTYSFFGGKTCESTITTEGAAYSHCQ